jgi:hypothetical protein
MTTRKLFLDDIRQPKDACYLVQDWAKLYFNDEWDVVKTHREFVSWIKRNGVPTHVSFDHDLADVHYDIDFDDWDVYTAEQLGVEETGLDSAKFLVDYCENNGFDLPLYQVHSANPIGRRNIKTYLDNAKKHLGL